MNKILTLWKTADKPIVPLYIDIQFIINIITITISIYPPDLQENVGNHA